jgi:hypothetical protein
VIGSRPGSRAAAAPRPRGRPAVPSLTARARRRAMLGGSAYLATVPDAPWRPLGSPLIARFVPAFRSVTSGGRRGPRARGRAVPR